MTTHHPNLRAVLVYLLTLGTALACSCGGSGTPASDGDADADGAADSGSDAGDGDADADVDADADGDVDADTDGDADGGVDATTDGGSGTGYASCLGGTLVCEHPGEESCMVIYNADRSGEIGGVCAGTCEAPGECPEPPTTGSAPVTCADAVGLGPRCYLSCADGETCPDGMECAINGEWRRVGTVFRFSAFSRQP